MREPITHELNTQKNMSCCLRISLPLLLAAALPTGVEAATAAAEQPTPMKGLIWKIGRTTHGEPLMPASEFKVVLDANTNLDGEFNRSTTMSLKPKQRPWGLTTLALDQFKLDRTRQTTIVLAKAK